MQGWRVNKYALELVQGQCHDGHIFPSCLTISHVAHFSKSSTFFHVWHIGPSVAHISKYGVFFRVWCIFPSLAHFSEYGAFFHVCRSFPSAAHYSNWLALFKCGLFFQVWRIFQSVRISEYSQGALTSVPGDLVT